MSLLEEFNKYQRKAKLLGVDYLNLKYKDNEVFVYRNMNCKEKRIVIPKFATRLWYSAFIGDKIEYIDLGNIKTIEECTFYDCKNLKEVVLSKYCKDILNDAFINCISLEKINLKYIRSIGKFAFFGCKSIKTIDLGNSLVYIGSRAFKECESIEEVIFPDSLRELGDHSFEGCINLKKVRLPKSKILIEKGTFRGCNKLKVIEVPKELVEEYKTMFSGCNCDIIGY